MAGEAFIYLWAAVGIVLMVKLGVFSPRPFQKAPIRRGHVPMLVVATGLLVYIGAVFMAQGVMGQIFKNGPHESAATLPATLPAAATGNPSGAETVVRSATSQPATREAATPFIVQTQPMTQTQSAIRSAGTQANTQPSTQRAMNLEGEFFGQVLNSLCELFAAGLMVFIASRLYIQGLSGWGLGLSQISKGVVAGLLGLMTMFPVLLIVNGITETLIKKFANREEEVHESLQMLSAPMPHWQKVVTVIMAVVCAPLVEEMFFRGALQSALVQPLAGFEMLTHENAKVRPSVLQRWVAIVVVSVFFARVHSLDHFSVLFPLALALGYLYERTGTLWASITLHAGFNAMVIWSASHASP